MAQNAYRTNDVLGMLSDEESEMDVDIEKESDFYESSTETSDDESLDISNYPSDSDNDSDDDSSGWRQWLPSDIDFEHFQFTAKNVGPTFDTTPQTELECFQRFFTDEVLNKIVTATNAYATIRLNNKQLTNNSTFYKWKDVTLQELKAYLGVILKMEMTEKPDVTDCFSKEWTEYSPYFLDILSRRRFLQIHWMLHLKSPEPTTAPITRKSKVSNVVSYIQDKCLQNYMPRQRIAVDESTVGFKGRIAFKTYNPQKSIKWGFVFM